MRKIFFVLFFILFFGASFSKVDAASLSFSGVPFTLSSSDSFFVDVYIDPEGQNINAVEGAVVFPDDLVSVKDIYNGRSVVTAWVESPKVIGSSVQFSGIMAGGFSSIIDPVSNTNNPGNLFRIVFEPKKEGFGVVSFENTHVYLNDGNGTEVSISSSDLPVTFVQGGSVMGEYITDINNPESFVPIVSRNDSVFDGKYFLVFETKDLETGIAYFEVKEGNGDWVKATSPYLLKDQSLKSTIRVKAVDNAGNSTIVTIGGKYTSIAVFVVIVLFAVSIIFSLLRFFRNKRRKI